MPDNGSGGYSRVAGSTQWQDARNAGDKIFADDHDTHDEDIATALTNRICKDGQTSTTARIPFASGISIPNGTAASPSICGTVAANANTGIYFPGSDNIAIAVDGTKIVDVTATQVSITGILAATSPIRAPDGSVGTPGFAFTGDTDNGAYRIGANNWALSAGGTKVLDFTTTVVTAPVTLLITGAQSIVQSTSSAAFAVGAAGGTNPAFRVNNSVASQATGILVTGRAAAAGADISVLSSAADENLRINALGTGTLTLQSTATGGITLTTAVTASSTLNAVGNFSVNTNKFNVTASSGDTTVAGTLGVTGIASFTAAIRAANGTQGAPSISFTNDTDNGLFYTGTANTWQQVAGGAVITTLTATSFDINQDFSVGSTSFTVVKTNGNTAVGGTLNVTGQATLSSQCDITGNLSVSTTFSVTAASGNLSSQGQGQFNTNDATPAGGSTSIRITVGSAAVGFYVGSGAPSVSAAKGSIYSRTDATTATTRFYINTDGGTSWTNFTTAA